jgi:hypothetical protein
VQGIAFESGTSNRYLGGHWNLRRELTSGALQVMRVKAKGRGPLRNKQGLLDSKEERG